MNILITGGVGFIGTNCAINFAKSKINRITLVDNFSRPGVESNAVYLKKNFDNVSVIKSDVRDTGKYLRYLKTSDLIIHLSGQTAVTNSITDPVTDFGYNLEGGFRLLEAVRNHNPKAVVIYSSTNKVYGNLNGHRLKLDSKKRWMDQCHKKGLSEDEPLDFISPYGCSKGAVDLYFLDYHRIYSLRTVVFRQSCIYGRYQLGVEDQGWVAHFSKRFLYDKPIKIYGDGRQVRDLLYADDLVDAYKKAYAKIEKVKGQAFNIGGGIENAFSLREVISILENEYGRKVKISYFEPRLGDQKYFASSNAKAKKLLGWAPRTGFSIGIRKLVDWQKKNLL